MYKNIELIEQLALERSVLRNRLRAAYIRMDYIEADIVLDLITTIDILLEKL